MAPEYPIVAHVGIGPIQLGVPRSEIRHILNSAGFPLESTRNQLDYFASASIQVEYDPTDISQFIGISFDERFVPTYMGINVFDVEADRLFRMIAKNEGSGVFKYDRNGIVFPNQLITLWDADSQYDRLGREERNVWGQVGIGNQVYWERIKRIGAEPS